MTTLDQFLPGASAGAGSVNLDVVRLSETPVVINVFSSSVAAVVTHYVEFSNFRGEVRCNAGLEPRCLLCDQKYKETKRAIMAVYDVASDLIKGLLISDTMSPHALGPQIQAELHKGDLDRRSLLISRVSNKFRVDSVPARTGQNMGERVIADFEKRLKSGEVSLESAIPVYPNLQLWDIPELERRAEAMGLSRSDYVRNGQTEATAK
jgi:hypothetical protein